MSTTLTSSWVGGGVKGRIRCVYSVSYTADRTQAIFTGTLYIDLDQYITDNYNSWAVSGDDGSHTGSNLAINLGSGGGSVAFYSNFSFQKYGDGTIAGSVSTLEAVGVTVSGTFTLDAGNLAPYFTNTNYSVRNVTPNSFYTTGIAAANNGTALTNVQVEVNTSASDTGASYFTSATWTDAQATGLQPATLYYYRCRVKNAGGYWSAWGPWKTMTTLSTIPGTPDAGWYFSDATQADFTIGGDTANNGGSAITSWDTQWSTNSDPSAGTIATGALHVTGLNPGTTYYARIRAVNANGVGPWSDVKAVTTLPGVSVNVGGVWKNAIPYVNVGGVWKPATRYVNVGGVWKQ